jgi:hypothetical protein
MRLGVSLLLVLALAAGGCAATAPGALQPLVLGWERYFTLDWQAAVRQGAPVVQGRIFNDAGFTASSIRLLVEGLDGTGRVIEQQVGWLGTPELNPGTSAFFEVPVERPAASYRVSVFAFDWVQRGGGGSLP